MTAAFSVAAPSNGKVDRLRRLGLDPIADAAERAVLAERHADAGAERIEGRITAGAACTTASTSARCW